MARDRQRAKQRQAERRAARLAQRGGDGKRDGADGGRDGEPKRRDAAPLDEPTPAERLEIDTGAPPEDVGRSDRLVASEQHPDVEELDAALDEEELDSDEPDLDEEELAAAEEELDAESDRPARRERAPAAHKPDRGRVLTFLAACWAELQRVQWPDRKALTQLTGIVLLFVLIAGGYLGLLDAIFSRVIEGIL